MGFLEKNRGCNMNQTLTFPYKTVFDEPWDYEWAEDWSKISEIFDTIDRLEELFEDLNVSYLRQLTQQKIIIDLQKYAYSLSKIISDKYTE